MAEKSKLIDLDGLAIFKENYDEEVDAKIADAGIGVTYTISKDTEGKIKLTGSDGSLTSVTDENTTYSFSEENHVLTITGSDGTDVQITLGGEITKDAIIEALGFTPVDADDIPEWAMAETKPTYTASEVGAIAITEKGVADGVATLGEDGKLHDDQLHYPSWTGTKAEYEVASATGRIADGTLVYITDDEEDLDSGKYYTKSEINSLMELVPKFKIEVVDSLNEISEPDTTTVYLVGGGNNSSIIFSEYIYYKNTWRLLGAQYTATASFNDDRLTLI